MQNNTIKDIVKTFEPCINYLVQKGAKNIYLDINKEKESVSIYTYDVILSEEEMKELSETAKPFCADLPKLIRKV